MDCDRARVWVYAGVRLQLTAYSRKLRKGALHVKRYDFYDYMIEYDSDINELHTCEPIRDTLTSRVLRGRRGRHLFIIR